MTEEQKAPDQDATGEDDPRKQLWIRASVAGGLIGLLLGGLAVFDHLSRPPAPVDVALPTKPIAPAQVAPEAGRDAPPEVLRAGNESPAGASAEGASAAPEGSAPPPLPEDEKLEKGGRVAEGTRPLNRTPAAAGVISSVPVEAGHKAAPRLEEAPRPALSPAVPPAPVVASPVVGAPPPSIKSPAVPVVASVPTLVPVPVAPLASTARPAAVSVPASPAPAVAAPVAGKVEAPRGYVLQFGVFSGVVPAEELRARLAQVGIPSQLETRVVVGPFAERKDALAAQARLRDKGIDVGTLLPLGR